MIKNYNKDKNEFNDLVKEKILNECEDLSTLCTQDKMFILSNIMLKSLKKINKDNKNEYSR